MISVDEALPQIADGIVAMKNRLDADNVKVGVYVDDIELEIALNANATKDGKLTIAADPLSLKSLSKSALSFDASQATKIEDLRGSKLIIKFKSANQYSLEYLDKLKGLVDVTAKSSSENSDKPSTKNTKKVNKSKLIDKTSIAQTVKDKAHAQHVMSEQISISP
ncbi:hypothetical protein PS357_15980 [Acinetobacter nosocomialis]|uniref:hypothetical protein n=1 Tax=Acinetobacter nosocomialis TaxID=106654 RepID=UPI00125ED861|nr:hypothetical protein [Acinetobacter nosocomialis]MDC9817215.1 hypothetical protein [Acinetobacter nosocomialis]MDE1701517.1 hypothetical protein [Acinetobacter nosocomialis]MDE9405526.1 hypothetical protein [Acinetobacter nosocomialis]